MNIFDYQQLTEEEKLARLPKEMQFLHKCPNFLNGKCASYNWGAKSPCWSCVKDGYYMPKSKIFVEMFEIGAIR